MVGSVRDSQTIDAASLPPVALIVGRMSSRERYKGHDAVLDAWPLIRTAVPDAKLVIVGTGDDERRLRRRVDKERLPAIEFRGRLSDEGKTLPIARPVYCFILQRKKASDWRESRGWRSEFLC